MRLLRNIKHPGGLLSLPKGRRRCHRTSGGL